MPTIRTLVAHQTKASGWTELEQKTIFPRHAEVIITILVKVILIKKVIRYGCLSLLFVTMS